MKIRKKGTMLSPDEINKIRQFYDMGLTDTAIAKIIERSPAAVGKVTTNIIYEKSPKLIEL